MIGKKRKEKRKNINIVIKLEFLYFKSHYKMIGKKRKEKKKHKHFH